ncbi:MAG: hypothetical protein IJ507_09095 [Clostridia bacterium]|nr:hypothetical protein [Clostridia bacterium]
MQERRTCQGRRITRRYRCSRPLLLAGEILLGAGLTLMFLCIPGWFWAALAGAALIIVGYALICRAMNVKQEVKRWA